jgi:hypothetical protein
MRRACKQLVVATLSGYVGYCLATALHHPESARLCSSHMWPTDSQVVACRLLGGCLHIPRLLPTDILCRLSWPAGSADLGDTTISQPGVVCACVCLQRVWSVSWQMRGHRAAVFFPAASPAQLLSLCCPSHCWVYSVGVCGHVGCLGAC